MSKLKIISLVASFLIVLSSSAFAFHNWNGYHWARTTDTFTLLVIDSTTPEWSGPFGESLANWASGGPIGFSVAYSDNSKGTRKRCSHVDGMMRVCNADYGYNGWLGLASIYLDSNGHITKGTAKMNDTYSPYWQTPGEMNHVMCQEIGHVLGLGHTSENGSSQGTCMDYSSDIDSQWPNNHDYEELWALYAHQDSYDSFATLDTGGTTGDTGDSSGCNAPKGKGCNKSSVGADIPPMGVIVHRGKQFEIRVASGLDGGLWIHHVYLVEPNEHEH